jgi:16S rRNA (guanine527-N7)-methyltransferase
MNLTSCADDECVIKHHFADSLSCVLSDLVQPETRLLDIGTGAGFPAIPLKIYEPGLRVTAVDAVTRKTRFVRHLCRVLELDDVRSVAARLDVHGHAPTGGRPALSECSFDLVTARAVGSLTTLLPLARPWLASGGYFLLQRGRQAQQELTEAAGWLQETGFQVARIVNVVFSFFEHPRYLILLRQDEKHRICE